MKKWLVIVNRRAGRAPVSIAAVNSALTTAAVDADIEVPSSPGEVIELVQRESDGGREYFAVAGGDGTVSLVCNALLSRVGVEQPVVGVLPVGTACDLLRTFGISQHLDAAARHLATDEVYPIDVVTLEGAWGTRYFVNVAQVGVGAAAAETAPRLARSLGSVRYPIAFAFRLPRFPVAQVTVETERRKYTSDALAVIMANAQFFAGGWNVAPKATLVDGVIDIQMINAHKSQAPALVPKVIRGTHLRDHNVRRFSAATFRIDTDIPWPLEADGDFVGNTPVSGRVVPAAIRLKI